MIDITGTSLAGYQPAPLEEWYRQYYFNNRFDISGSGVEEYSFKQIRDLAQFDFAELDSHYLKDIETAGSLQVREQLAALFGKGNPETVVVTNGANEALQFVMRAILAPGDHVVTLGPCYHCHDKIAVAMGCKVSKWQLSPDKAFALDLEQLEEMLTPDTKALVLNFPHNPTGKSISQAMLDQIIALVRDRSMYLVWDAAFQELTYDHAPLIDPVHAYENTITVGTFSKAYGAPGLRFGWIIAPSNVVNACVRQKDYGNLYVAPLTEFIASKMLDNIEAFSKPRLLQASKNRDHLEQWFIQNNDRTSWNLPNGGVCGLMSIPKMQNDIDFCERLVQETGVLLVPGSCFDMPGYARIGFGGNPETLVTGLDLLAQFLVTREL